MESLTSTLQQTCFLAQVSLSREQAKILQKAIFKENDIHS
jgi:hypothetical protein